MSYIDDIPIDMFNEIFNYLTYDELRSLLLINKLFYNRIINYIENLLKLIGGFYIIHDNNYLDACIKNHFIIIYLNDKNVIRELGLFAPCYSTRESIIDYVYKLLYNYDNVYTFNRAAIRGACKGGSLNIIKKFIKYIDEEIINYMLKYVGFSGNIDSINYILSLNYNIDYTDLLYGLCKGNHITIFKLFENKIYGCDIYYLLYGACRGGSINIVKYILDNYYISDMNINLALQGACQYSPFIKRYKWNNSDKFDNIIIDIIELLIQYGASDFITGFQEACRYNYPIIMKYMIKKGVKECLYCNRNVNEHLIDS